MKNIFFLVVILAAVANTGCLSDSKRIDTPAPVPATVAQPVTPVDAPVTSSNENNAQNSAGQTATANSAAPTVVSKPVSTAALNPAHGQPGHRCDIAVGAPLDSKPVQATIQTPQQQQQPTTITAAPIAAKPIIPAASGPGLNPEHGKPGHRCDIAVGAPLNSKPAQ